MSATDRSWTKRLAVRPVRSALIAGTLSFTGVAGVALAADLVRVDDTKVASLLKARLPKTSLSKVDCSKVSGLCEVTAESNLFYVDHSGRYLVIGRVYDMETRQDLTATRLLEINPDMLVGGAAKANASGDDEGPLTGPAPGGGSGKPAAPAPAKNISVAALPAAGSIVWGNPSGKTVTVFSDFRCGYCKALSAALTSLNVRVVERPISVLGTRELSNQVYCAKDRVAALHSAYAGEALKNSGSCDTSGLDANERFARQHGLGGTPVIVRSDGAVIEGYRPKEALAAWLAGAKS